MGGYCGLGFAIQFIWGGISHFAFGFRQMTCLAASMEIRRIPFSFFPLAHGGLNGVAMITFEQKNGPYAYYCFPPSSSFISEKVEKERERMSTLEICLFARDLNLLQSHFHFHYLPWVERGKRFVWAKGVENQNHSSITCSSEQHASHTSFAKSNLGQ